jgi:hypothetical protein
MAQKQKRAMDGAPSSQGENEKAGPLRQAFDSAALAQDDWKNGTPSGIFELELTFGLEKRDDE